MAGIGIWELMAAKTRLKVRFAVLGEGKGDLTAAEARMRANKKGRKRKDAFREKN